jgi:hypothetical protein
MSNPSTPTWLQVADLAVVHLVRRQNGIAPLKRFLDSYSLYPSGVPHDLVILFKGFREIEPEYAALLSGAPCRHMLVSDRGFDINAYFEAIESLDYQYFCFLNSFSRILAEGWLSKLFYWVCAPEVGLVGATGSCQSIAGGYTTQQRALAALAPGRQVWVRLKGALRDKRPKARSQRAWRLVLRLFGVWRPARDFPPFPNHHLRTNAFMASRETLRRIKLKPLRTKISAYRFESGKESLTSQVRNLGLRVLVVGRDGKGYEPDRWHVSNTFWQSAEENLLVADNQTEAYLSADAATRAELAQYAWGEFARPD